MEASLSSSKTKSIASKSKGRTKTTEDQESGWTSYFEDFMSKKGEHSSCSDTFTNPSLVSDAASYVAWNVSNSNNQVVACPSMIVVGSPTYPKKLNFKKTRSKEISYDDSLEDTASSPVHSPKVSSLKQMGVNNRRTDDNVKSLGKVGAYGGHYSELQEDERNEMKFEGKSNEYREMKKKGLCLVPLSMVVNYLG